MRITGAIQEEVFWKPPRVMPALTSSLQLFGVTFPIFGPLPFVRCWPRSADGPVFGWLVLYRCRIWKRRFPDSSTRSLLCFVSGAGPRRVGAFGKAFGESLMLGAPCSSRLNACIMSVSLGVSTTSASGWAPDLAETPKLPAMKAFSTRMLSSTDCVALHGTSTVMHRFACAEACSQMLLVRVREPFPTSARTAGRLVSPVSVVALSHARAGATGGSPADCFSLQIGLGCCFSLGPGSSWHCSRAVACHGHNPWQRIEGARPAGWLAERPCGTACCFRGGIGFCF